MLRSPALTFPLCFWCPADGQRSLHNLGTNLHGKDLPVVSEEVPFSLLHTRSAHFLTQKMLPSAYS